MKKLGALLRNIATRRAPDCSWLFPSPQRGPATNMLALPESLLLARKGAGLLG